MLNFVGKDNFVWWTGIVEDVENDPLKIGRVRVRIIGYYDEEVSTEELPWAMPIMPIHSASLAGVGTSPTGVMVGSWCVGFFKDSEYAQEPIIWGTLPGRQGGQTEGKARNGRGQTVPSTLSNYSAQKASGVPTLDSGVIESGQLIPQISDTDFNLSLIHI